VSQGFGLIAQRKLVFGIAISSETLTCISQLYMDFFTFGAVYVAFSHLSARIGGILDSIKKVGMEKGVLVLPKTAFQNIDEVWFVDSKNMEVIEGEDSHLAVKRTDKNPKMSKFSTFICLRFAHLSAIFSFMFWLTINAEQQHGKFVLNRSARLTFQPNEPLTVKIDENLPTKPLIGKPERLNRTSKEKGKKFQHLFSFIW